MNKTAILTTSLIALAAFSFHACKDDEAPVPVGKFIMHMHTNIDSTEVEAGDVAKDANGRRFQLDKAQFILSGVQLKKADGTYQLLDNVYVLKDIETEELEIGNVPAGNYVSVKFTVGVDASNNVKAPSAFTGSNPLADVNNWFGSADKGFIFLNVEGKADVSAGQNGSVDHAFSYQLGTSANLKTIELPNQAFSVVANQDNFVHLTCDYGLLLEGIDFSVNASASPFTNAAVCNQIANNISRMFRYEE